jgi:tetratricopeptide (TPR) repeat protein
VLCVLLLAGITLLVLWTIKAKPYMTVGWFWFLGTLVPVIGLVQVGNTPVADRFTYVPQIGLYLMIAWAVRDLTGSWPRRRQWQVAAAAMVITASMVCASVQTSYWRNSESLWTHTLACNPENVLAHNNLGNALFQKGRVDEAIFQYQKALQINPDYAKACYNLGNALLQKGSVDEAITHFQKALQIKPDYVEAQNNLAWMLATCPQASLRNGNKAVELAQRANQLTGDGNPVVLGTLAAAYAEAGRFPEAVETAQRALQLAGTQSNTALADDLRSQMKLYQAGLPFHLH